MHADSMGRQSGGEELNTIEGQMSQARFESASLSHTRLSACHVHVPGDVGRSFWSACGPSSCE